MGKHIELDVFGFLKDNTSARGQCATQEGHWALMVSEPEGKCTTLLRMQGKWSFHSEFADI